MSRILQRPVLAESMARQLLNPDVLDESLRSGVFLFGPRRTGKTTFLRNDLDRWCRESDGCAVGQAVAV